MIGKFQRPAAGKAAPAAQRKSRYAGIQNSNRDPMPDVGKYRFRVLSLEECTNPGTLKESVKAHIAPVEMRGDAYVDGAPMLALFMRTTAGLAELKRLVVAAAGFDDAEAYDEFDPDGFFIDACVGLQNEFSEHTIIGRLVDGVVTRGKDTGDGDFYRQYQWSVVPDSEQDQTPSRAA